MKKLEKLNVKLFADGADLDSMREMYANPLIQGFTTNPSLMRKAGIQNYGEFAKEVIALIPDKQISFEVFSDDFDGMEKQALEISNWGKNINVKIPVTNTNKKFSGPLIKKLSQAGVSLNITAIMTLEQVEKVVDCLSFETPAFISVFAGRIADTGVDPVPIMRKAVEIMKVKPKSELIWASPRELLNIFQADAIGCHIITATNDILKKINLIGKDLDEYSVETVEMFYKDALAANYQI